jgi:hypothetical protein
VANDRERNIAAHRDAADNRLVDMQGVEEIDDVAGIVIDRRRGRIAGAAAKPAQVRSDHAPTEPGEGELRVEHPRVEGKGMDEEQRPARAHA